MKEGKEEQHTKDLRTDEKQRIHDGINDASTRIGGATI